MFARNRSSVPLVFFLGFVHPKQIFVAAGASVYVCLIFAAGVFVVVYIKPHPLGRRCFRVCPKPIILAAGVLLFSCTKTDLHGRRCFCFCLSNLCRKRFGFLLYKTHPIGRSWAWADMRWGRRAGEGAGFTYTNQNKRLPFMHVRCNLIYETLVSRCSNVSSCDYRPVATTAQACAYLQLSSTAPRAQPFGVYSCSAPRAQPTGL